MKQKLTPEQRRQILIDLLRVQVEDVKFVHNKNLQIISEIAGGGMENLKRVVVLRQEIIRDITLWLSADGFEHYLPPEVMKLLSQED